MTVIVNTPPAPKESGGNMGLIIGLIVLMAAAYLFFVFGLPAIQRMKLSSPQINVPSKIDVNINQ